MTVPVGDLPDTPYPMAELHSSWQRPEWQRQGWDADDLSPVTPMAPARPVTPASASFEDTGSKAHAAVSTPSLSAWC